MFEWVPLASASSSTFMPPAATEVAKQVNSLYAFMLIASVISFVILVGGMIFFVVKYKRKTATDQTPYITHSYLLEFLWSFVPFVIFIACFGWGTYVYLQMRDFDQPGLEVNVYGKKWVWEFEYKNGHKVTPSLDAKGVMVPSTLVVPINVKVKLVMTSIKVSPQDKAVLHSFYVPAFRIKQDLVPGRFSALTFTAIEKGTFQVFCTEFCGTGHSSMLAKIKVVSQDEFDAYILGDEGGGTTEMSMVDKGRGVYAKYACIGCHSVDGSKNVGPTWKGLYGSNRDFNEGASVVADENYIRESIWEPNKHIVKGYEPNKMPVFKGTVSEEEVAAVIEFMKTLK